MKTCKECGQLMGGTRADRRYCSPACRQRASRARRQQFVFPRVMTSSDSWCRFRTEERKNGKKAKIPVQLDGRNASSTNPATWTDYESARRSTTGAGLGFVLTNGVGCIDLDGYLDHHGVPVDGGALLASFLDADVVFVERSLSGRGIHVFKRMAPGRGTSVPIEIYPPDSGRFIAVTGDRFKF